MKEKNMTQAEALKTAIRHIDHMAAWITKQNAGYSFESLGEDMPGIRAALAPGNAGAVEADDAVAGNAFRDTLIPRADSANPFPLWHGWAIMEAFLAGAKYARQKSAAPLPATQGDDK